MEDFLFFDIETEVHEDASEYVMAKRAPKNWKDPLKIAEYEANSVAEQLEHAPLDADLGAIKSIAVGKYDVDGEPVVDVTLAKDVGEDQLLIDFWKSSAKRGGRVCGYNILGFDLPYLMRRSMDLGITPDIRPNLARYRTEPVRDLMAILYNWGPAKSLKFVAKRYLRKDHPEIPDVWFEQSGAQVADMDTDTLLEYAKQDVLVCMLLHALMTGVYF